MDLSEMYKDEVLTFIRGRLAFDTRVRVNHVDNDLFEKEHKRFDMSGYDGGRTGTCTTHNQSILNLFADLGIYDYTHYIVLDFYKGGSDIYYRYWGEYEDHHMENGGMRTVELIYDIFKLTILSGRTHTRRRD